jgi:hypothetical protein
MQAQVIETGSHLLGGRLTRRFGEIRPLFEPSWGSCRFWKNLHMRAKTRRFVFLMLMMVTLFIAQGAEPEAAVVQIDGSGLATGILGLTVGSETYDIDFAVGTYNDIFPGGAVFSNALDISNAINAALNSTGSPLLAPSPSQVVDFYGLPQALVPLSVTIIVSDCFEDTGACGAPWAVESTFAVDRSGDEGPWAIATAVTLSPVPIPAALPLFLSALAGLGLFGWRRKRGRALAVA